MLVSESMLNICAETEVWVFKSIYIYISENTESISIQHDPIYFVNACLWSYCEWIISARYSKLM